MLEVQPPVGRFKNRSSSSSTVPASKTPPQKNAHTKTPAEKKTSTAKKLSARKRPNSSKKEATPKTSGKSASKPTNDPDDSKLSSTTKTKQKRNGQALNIPRRRLPSKRMRSVSSTAQKRWRPLVPAARKHLRSLLHGIFPLVLNPIRNADRKQLVQENLYRVTTDIDKALDTLTVPVTSALAFESTLVSSNRLLEERLMIELDRLSKLQEQLDEEQRASEAELQNIEWFTQAKTKADGHNNNLHRHRLHPSLRTSRSHDTEDVKFEQEEAALRRMVGPATTTASIYEVENDGELKSLLRSIHTHLAAAEAASSLPVETATQLGELGSAARTFLRAMHEEKAVLFTL